jgi:hypothetical protein
MVRFFKNLMIITALTVGAANAATKLNHVQCLASQLVTTADNFKKFSEVDAGVCAAVKSKIADIKQQDQGFLAGLFDSVKTKIALHYVYQTVGYWFAAALLNDRALYDTARALKEAGTELADQFNGYVHTKLDEILANFDMTDKKENIFAVIKKRLAYKRAESVFNAIVRGDLAITLDATTDEEETETAPTTPDSFKAAAAGWFTSLFTGLFGAGETVVTKAVAEQNATVDSDLI